MKKEKGITLISLIITVIAITMTLSILAVISSAFFSNTKLLKEDTKGMAEYNKFAMYFIEDCKKNSNVYNISTSKIEFEDGTVYTFSGSRDKSIYRNKVKICKNIGYCHFLQNEITVNGVTKQLVNVHMVVEAGGHFETNIDYVLKYW